MGVKIKSIVRKIGDSYYLHVPLAFINANMVKKSARYEYEIHHEVTADEP